MKKYLTLILFLASLSVQAAALLKPQKLGTWGIPFANYSGITRFSDDLYAVVSDKEPLDGFYVWQVVQDKLTGQIQGVANRGYAGQVPLDTNSEGISLRDAEDIIYCPQRGSFFVCGEGYQDIIELDKNGQRTGYELSIPDDLRNIYPNYGFEALAYDSASCTFYTTTENVLPSDGLHTSPLNHQPATLHIQSYTATGENGDKIQFEQSSRYDYSLDLPRAVNVGRSHAHGVVAMTALGDGRIAVLEREAYISQSYIGSWVVNKLYIVDTKVAAGLTLNKTFVTEWETHIRAVDYSWANYEGMCLGQPLPDGRSTLILVSDSQAGFGLGPFRLQDYIRVVVL